MNVFGFEVLPESLHATFAPDPTLAPTAPGRVGPEASAAIDADGAATQTPCHGHGIRCAAEDGRIEPEPGVVGEGDGLVDRLVPHNDADGTKELAPGYLRRVRDPGDKDGVHVVALGQIRSATTGYDGRALVTFHSDGSVSPPIPLLDIQCMVTRRSLSGRLHGPEQQISLDDAFKAHTINAARQLKRDHDLGSLEVGKLADFVELSADPFTVDSDKLTDQVKVLGTWVDGVRVDPDAFITHVQAIDPTEHKDLPQAAVTSKCC